MGRCSYNRILNIKKEKIHSFFFSNKKVKKLRKHIESKLELQLLLLRARARKTKYCSLPMEFFFLLFSSYFRFLLFLLRCKSQHKTSPTYITTTTNYAAAAAAIAITITTNIDNAPKSMRTHRNHAITFFKWQKKEIILKRIKTKMIVE